MPDIDTMDYSDEEYDSDDEVNLKHKQQKCC